MPRWLIAFFCSALICAVVTSKPSGDEDRIVAESALAAGGVRQRAAHLAALDELAPIRRYQDSRRHESGTAVAVGHVGELIKEQAQVRLVIPVGAGPARGEDAGCSHPAHPP